MSTDGIFFLSISFLCQNVCVIDICSNVHFTSVFDETLPKHNEYLDEDFNEQIVFQDL